MLVVCVRWSSSSLIQINAIELHGVPTIMVVDDLGSAANVFRREIAVTVRDRKAHLVGGGIGSLAAAAFMIRDGGMPGGNITIYEALPVLGGSLDARAAITSKDTPCAADAC